MIIFYTLYRRFILQRLPRGLELFTPEFKWNLLIIMSFSIVISIYIIIKSVRILLNKGTRESILSRVMAKISDVIDQAYFQVYALLASNIPNNYDKISSFVKIYYNFWGKRPDEQIHLIVIGCRFIRLGAFLFDVFYFFELKWFYKSLLLLCIPLIINTIIFILRDFAPNKDEAGKYLTITPVGTDPKTGESLLTFELAKGYESADFKYLLEEYAICSKISGYLTWYDIYKAFFTPRVNLIIYSLYLIGWLYVIYTNIELLLS